MLFRSDYRLRALTRAPIYLSSAQPAHAREKMAALFVQLAGENGEHHAEIRVSDRPLAAWRPRPWALQLLGDPGATPRAIAWWGPLSWGPSAWLWHWKQRMDRRFIASFDRLKQDSSHAG